MIAPDNIVEVREGIDLAEYYRAIERDTVLAYDTETGSLDYKADVFLQIGYASGKAYLIDKRVAHPDLWDDFAAYSLAKGRTLLGHNLGFDLMKMRLDGGNRFLGKVHDTLILSFLLDENRPHGLKELAEKEWGPEASAYEKQVIDWLDKFNEGKKNYDRVPNNIMYPYAANDVLLTRRYFDKYYPSLEKQRLTRIYETECELIKALVDMRSTGVRLDVPYLKTLVPKFTDEATALKLEIDRWAGKDINLHSPKQVIKLIYTDLGLPVNFITPKGNPSTDDEALSSIEHPIGKMILNYRDKMKSNAFIENWLGFADSDGYVHPNLNQTGARSGRFSCSNPNFQNIPHHSPSAKALRRAFINPDGMVGGATDQSQIELAIFAHYAKDQVMIKAMRAGQDLHRVTAYEIGLAPTLEAITEDQRRLGKGAGFSVIFGCGAAKLGSFLSQYAGRHVSSGEAQQIMSRYKMKFRSVKEFSDTVQRVIMSRPGHFVTNLFGRRCHLIPQMAYIGVNRLIQSTAADFAKYGIVQAWKAAQGTDLRLSLSIHDELRWNSSEKWFEDAARTVYKAMTESPYPLNVPIRATTKICRTNWATEENYENAP